MRKLWAATLFFACLFAVVVAVACSDSSDAKTYNFAGYVDGGMANDPNMDIVIAEMRNPKYSGDNDEIVLSDNEIKYNIKGLKNGWFTGTTEDVTFGVSSHFFIRIRSDGYQIGDLPTSSIYVYNKEYKLNTDDKNVWYRFNMSEVLKSTNTKEIDSITHYLLSSDESTLSALTLVPAEQRTVRGTVSSGSVGIAGASVELIDRNSNEMAYEGQTDKNGMFRIDFRPATYHIRVTADGYKTYYVEDYDLNYTGDGAIPEITIEVEPEKGTDIPRALMYIAAVTGVLLILASFGYRMYLRKHPEKSVIYDDET